LLIHQQVQPVKRIFTITDDGQIIGELATKTYPAAADCEARKWNSTDRSADDDGDAL